MDGEIRPAIGDFPAGSRIASYQIEQLIGRGGMAVVYRAADVRLDRLVALKVLAPELIRDDAFRRRFIAESRSGAAVDHPNVIPVFEAGEAQDVLFIAMRYVTGGDVRGLIDREGKLPTGRAVSIVTQVASALDAAHAHGLIHRDVKPANMLLATVGSATAPDHIYLSDFGLSKLSVSAVSLTGTGQFLGTLDYMSPEQVEGRPVDGRTDLYALGCAAFEMLTGEPPFRREQNLAVMWAQVSAPPPSVRQLRPDLSAAVDEVLGRALAKAPENRQPSCLEFAAELRAACASDRARAAGAASPPGAAGAGAAAARPGTELAFAAPPIAPPGQPASPPPGPAGAGGSRMPAVGPMSPGFDATITEATPAVTAAQPPGWPTGPPSGSPSAPPSPPPGRTENYWEGGPGYQSPPPTRRRGRALPILAVIIVLAALAGAAFYVLHLRGGGNAANGPTSPPVTKTVTQSTSPSSSPSSSTSPTSSATAPPPAPDAVVTDFFTAINEHHYQQAWRLDYEAHAKESFATFKSDYATTTANDSVTILGVSGDVVTMKLVAQQKDGTVKTFQGTYTVQNGTIVGSAVTQTS